MSKDRCIHFTHVWPHICKNNEAVIPSAATQEMTRKSDYAFNPYATGLQEVITLRPPIFVRLCTAASCINKQKKCTGNPASKG